MPDRTCSVEGCDRTVIARGLCSRDYQRARQRDALPPLVPKSPDWIESTDGCWIWQWRPSSTGYGTKHVNGRTVLAHRWVYEQHHGAIPVGMQLDHLCHTVDVSCPGGSACLHRRCVNPEHLEPVTDTDNKLRGRSENARNARKKFCVRGHPFDGANTYIRGDTGGRQCLECQRMRDKKRKRKRSRA